MPVNADPDPAGNVTLADDPGGVCTWANVRTVGSAAYHAALEAGQLYMPHHATCPDGPKWRRRQVKQRAERRA
ncbi:MAG: hypothetical protein IT435_05395 [Phycisphaerales bacterium]|nr:hypothetical protein [Phycisphaerales bacterium]